MKIDFTSLLAPLDCACGKRHTTDVRRVVMETDALSRLPEVIRELGDFSSIAMICDENTYAVAGKQVEYLCAPDTVVILTPDGLHANEHSIKVAEAQLPDHLDLLIAVGSGTIHDITRYITYGRKIQFISVPTAASVDGYVSNVAAMTLQGTKKTVIACAPIALVADLGIIAAAPTRLTASGVGDMLGKYTALADWKIARRLTGEYYCPHVVDLMEQALASVVAGLDRLQENDVEATASLMYGLVLSGVAMQHTGVSRPASGAEHHISHFIEVTMSDRCDALHGEKVGVGMILVSHLYHRFAALSNEQIQTGLSDYQTASDEEYGELFGVLAPVLKQENTPDCALSVTVQTVLEHLSEIRSVIAELPPAEELTALLSRCGACTTLEEINLSSEELLPDLYHNAPLIRNRLTLMRLLRYFSW